MKLITLLVIFCVPFVTTGKTAAKSKIDTIYYFLDTLHTASRDRIISIEDEGSIRAVKVNCHCLKNFETPVFLFKPKDWIPLKRENFESLKLLTLVKLMELTRAVSSTDFQLKYVFYIIESRGDDYVKYRAVAMDREKRIGDAVPIKTGG